MGRLDLLDDNLEAAGSLLLHSLFNFRLFCDSIFCRTTVIFCISMHAQGRQKASQPHLAVSRSMQTALVPASPRRSYQRRFSITAFVFF
jgi:hypothetical protein